MVSRAIANGRLWCPPRVTAANLQVIMATRRERWLKYRKRCLKRAAHQRNRGWAWESPGHGTGAFGARKRIARKWEHEDRGLMPECFVSAELREHGGPVPGYSFPWTYSVLPAKYRLPPVPFITGSGYAEHREIAHLMFAVHGYHRRRVHAWGRKSTAKMTGITRRLWYEAWFYVHNGYYRDVDPLARHPSETDVANGAPSDPDPQWPGIPEL